MQQSFIVCSVFMLSHLKKKNCYYLQGNDRNDRNVLPWEAAGFVRSCEIKLKTMEAVCFSNLSYIDFLKGL